MSKISAAAATILMIDDDAELASVFCDTLALNGFSTLRVTTGRAGVQLAQQQPPQLIICNIGLPDISGYEVLKQLRSHPSTLTIPVIALAGHNIPDTFRRSMEHGADDYLIKPIKPKSLLRAVQAQLIKREQLIKHFSSASVRTSKGGIEFGQRKIQMEDRKQALWSRIWTVEFESYSSIRASYGHVFGQLALQAVSHRLQQWQDQWDNPKISLEALAYLETNRFVIFLSALTKVSAKQQDAAIAKLKTVLQAPLAINNHQLMPEIGIWSTDISQQDNVYTLSPHLPHIAVAETQLSMVEKLRQAIRKDQLQLYFQPQVDLSSGQIVGAEALVRWIVPGRPPLLPAEFLPAAEENNLILPLGDWVLQKALQQLSRWQKMELSGLTMAVNLSAYQLNSSSFIERLTAAVNMASVNPIMLDLELPESVIMADPNYALKLLTNLQSLGFSIALDDFGSGLSTLSHLQHLPVNILKIDKCFVRDLHQNRANQIVVKAIMEMARGLNISTTASGVETARELAILKQLNCRTMQGYLFSPALPAEDFETLFLQKNQESPQQLAISKRA